MRRKPNAARMPEAPLSPLQGGVAEIFVGEQDHQVAPDAVTAGTATFRFLQIKRAVSSRTNPAPTKADPQELTVLEERRQSVKQAAGYRRPKRPACVEMSVRDQDGEISPRMSKQRRPQAIPGGVGPHGDEHEGQAGVQRGADGPATGGSHRRQGQLQRPMRRENQRPTRWREVLGGMVMVLRGWGREETFKKFPPLKSPPLFKFSTLSSPSSPVLSGNEESFPFIF